MPTRLSPAVIYLICPDTCDLMLHTSSHPHDHLSRPAPLPTLMQTPTASLAAAGSSADTIANAATTVASVVSTTGAGAAGAAAASTGLSAFLDSIVASTPILGSLGVLTMVIALHEAGHLVAALSQGIKVKGFSIGFGPKLLSYRSPGKGEGGVGGAAGLGGLMERLSGPSWNWGGGEEDGGVAGGAEAKSSKGATGRGRVEEAVDQGVEVRVL